MQYYLGCFSLFISITANASTYETIIGDTVDPIKDIYGNDHAYSGANLGASAQLANADLSNAFLPNALLYGSNLVGANLSNADLSDAWIDSSDFTGANLSNMTFTNGWSLSAYFTHANLSGANLSGSVIGNANFGSADLTGSNLTNLIGWLSADFNLALYDNDTVFGVGMNPVDLNMIFVSEIPLPASIWLLVSGLAALRLSRR